LAEKYDPDFMNVVSKEKLGWWMQPDGKTYGYPNASWSMSDIKNAKTASSNYSFLVRKDIYEALGKPDMTTPDGFVNALKAAKQKYPTVNGQPLIPVGFAEFGAADGSLGIYLQDLLGIPYEKDGKVADRRADPEYAKWLKAFRKANELKLISNDVFVDKRQQIEDKMAQSRYFAIMYPWIDAQQPLTSVYERSPDKMYISIAGPANSDKSLKPIYPGPGISGWTLTLITKNCKDPAGALKLAKLMISDKGQELAFLGKEGVTFEKVNGVPQLLPAIKELRSTNRKDYDQKYGIDYMNWMFMDNAVQDRLWPQPNEGPLAQIKAYTFDKLTSLVAYDAIGPQPIEKEGIIEQKINMK
jgi:putative aldouronate transport system substrate-binding protein